MAGLADVFCERCHRGPYKLTGGICEFCEDDMYYDGDEDYDR